MGSTLDPCNCNAPFAGFSNCGLPKGHTGAHAHAMLRVSLPDNEKTPPEGGVGDEENERLLALDRATYGICVTDIHGKRVDPTELTPYT